ncbi:MAG: hypothetical protein SVX43_13775 [Cyanobacteriota bacterium]|nr:hypothetical protein [Cyanobacteriota bacterium]
MNNYSAKIGDKSSVTGIVIQGNTHGNIEYNHVKSDSDNTSLSEPKKTLAEAATEIQQLLKQLEATNPTVTDAEKIAYVNDETTPSFKRRVVKALKAGGEVAIEEFLDNSYFNIGKAIVKSWLDLE